MRLGAIIRRFGSREDLPPEIYVSLVDSLYSDARSLFVGSLSAAAAAFITTWRTGDPFLVVCSIALAVVACLRAKDMQLYAKKRLDKMTAVSANVWETRYVIGSVTFVALMGLWSCLALTTTSDPFVHLLAVAITIAYMVGITGRNFGFDHLVILQIVAVAIPMNIGFFLNGNIYYTIVAPFTLPFFISLRSISARLRQTLFDAVIATRDITQLADRFDTALNNMPHGLCMFDSDGRLVVANKRLFELFDLPTDTNRKGRSAVDLVKECAGQVMSLKVEIAEFAREFEMRRLARRHGNHSIELADARTLDLTFQPMANGGSVVLIEDSTERRNAEATMRHMARYDSLTGLVNRTFLQEKMNTLLPKLDASHESCGVLFIDLDHFKQVNDTLGHPCGDELLREVSERLKGCARPNDVVARFGGDEFIVLRSPVADREEVDKLVQTVVDTLSGVYEIQGHEVAIGTSIGVAMAPDDGMNADELLKKADMALYRAKFEGRGAWRFFKPEMEEEAQARRSLELDLRSALAEDAFDLHYQPLLNLKSNKISGCEALLRWNHPERGMVSPAEFIPVAEEMGLIVDIGNLVIQKACMECMKWPDNVSVAVNFSTIQFERSNVVSVINDALKASGLPASRLEVEITESVFMQNTEETLAILDELRALGVRISLDDFGTGYSSLSYLQAFPLNKVKIDRSFVKDLGTSDRSMTLVRNVARLSTELGLSVVVEGIETDNQLMLVAAEETIDEAQGFLFSRPLPSAQISSLLSAALPKWNMPVGKTSRIRRALPGKRAG